MASFEDPVAKPTVLCSEIHLNAAFIYCPLVLAVFRGRHLNEVPPVSMRLRGD